MSDLKELEKSFNDEDKSEPVPPTDIVAYNELRSCADLFRLSSGGMLEIQPDFQRDVVWKQDEQTRFIDSLVKQLPIPSMCFSLDFKTQKWKVIDGLQRMSSIIRFFSASEWKLSDLNDIRPELRNTKNSELKHGTESQKLLYGMVENVSIPITVIRCDYTQKSHMTYLFTIFHRLNSGGVRLTNQEIRNCIYTGDFNKILKSFDATNSSWKLIKKRIWGSMDRFRSVEVILRILAFSEKLQGYDGNLAGFLNDYMYEKSALPSTAFTELEPKLSKIATMAVDILSCEAQKKQPLALVESILVGLFLNYSKVEAKSKEELLILYAAMKEKPSFTAGARYAVSSAENVKARLNDAIEAFAG